MRRILAPAALLALGLLAPAAALDAATGPTVTAPTVTVPTVTVPTVTVPPVTTPVVTTPRVTTPPVTTPPVTTPPVATSPVTTPTVSTPAATAPLPKPPARGPSAPSTGTTPVPAPSAAPDASSAQPGSADYQPATGRPSAPLGSYAATGAASRRATRRGTSSRPTVIRFRLAKPAHVHVTVWQEAPRCRRIGRYTYVGGRGRNVLRLPRRVGKTQLTTGTYRLVGVAVHREILDVRVRVVRKGRTLQVRHDRLEDACMQTVEATGLLGTAVFGGNAGVFSAGSETGGVQGANATRSRGSGGAVSAGRPNALPFSPKTLLGAKSATARTLLFVLLGLAVALLAAGSVPASGAGATPVAAIARHRAAVTSAGFAMIVAAVLAALLT